MKKVICSLGVASLIGCAHVVRNIASEVISKKTITVQKINSEEELRSIAEASGGVIRQGFTVKLLLDNRDLKKPQVYFLNANYCPEASCATPPKEAVFHYNFAKKVLKNITTTEAEYFNTAYYTKTIQDRKFFDARIQQFHLEVDGVDTSYYGVRFIERDLIDATMTKYALTEIAKALNIPGQKLAILINSETQKVTEIQPWLDSQNIKAFTMEQILSGVNFVGLNPGIAYGMLRVFPANEEDLEPYDIPVFASLPLDLSVVAGTISTEYQDVGSHVNLKSKERGTPNMVLRGKTDVEKLKALDGRPVRLKVDYTGYAIEEVDQKVVFDAYQKKTAGPWTTVGQVNMTELVHFDQMCAKENPKKCLEKSRGYGGKVAGLGFLAHPTVAGMGSPLQKKMGYRLSPIGFGLPLSQYNAFMKLNMEKNQVLRRTLTKLIDSEMGMNGALPLTPTARRELIAQVQAEILKGEIPKDLYDKDFQELQKLKEETAKAYPGTELDKLKVRSSSNAEDIKGFNGAGLHDSYSAKISLSGPNDASSVCEYVSEVDEDTALQEQDVKPKNLACAIKGAYASLWNMRAVRERTFKKFDHHSAAMGLSVQTSYKFRKGQKIRANSVMITRVLGTENVYGQQLSTQVGNGLVTNPVPNTKSELAVIAFDATESFIGINILQYAKPFADKPVMTEKVMSREDMLKMSEIGRAVEIKYCEAIPDYFPGADCKYVVNSQKKALAIDMEFKVYTNNEILIKQVRTFSGR
ncbi:MAG: hypothetical protein H7326_03640 [Bdellovibrionaceae bacterium]|nr:hypothetical protein [Pseudobdellovibrionaceae bacterium]